MAEPAETAEQRLDQMVATIAASDFPASARVVQRLYDAVRKENCNALDVARIILADPGLSSKVLRVVNSSFYRPRGEPVSTITRAVILLGFEAIRDLTIGVVLIDEIARLAGGRPVVREVLHQCLLCGSLARALSTTIGYPNPEEAYLLGLFANLGQLGLAAYYHDEYERALQLVHPKYFPLDRALGEVFGVASGDLATAMLARWNFPPSFSEYFRAAHPPGDRPVTGNAQRLFAIVDLANDCAAQACDPEPDPAARAETVRRFEAMFQRSGAEMLEAIEHGLADVRDDAPVMRVATSGASGDSHAAETRKVGGLRGVMVSGGAEGTGSTAAFEILAEISRGILAQDNINDTLAMVLEGVARTGHFDVAFLALLNGRKDRLVGRLGYGDGVGDYLSTLNVPLAAGAGVLADAALAREPRVVAQGTAAMLVAPGAPMPNIPAASFVVQPLLVRGKVVGVMVATRGGGPAVGSAEVTIVQLFCNHAGLALDRAVG